MGGLKRVEAADETAAQVHAIPLLTRDTSCGRCCHCGRTLLRQRLLLFRTTVRRSPNIQEDFNNAGKQEQQDGAKYAARVSSCARGVCVDAVCCAPACEQTERKRDCDWRECTEKFLCREQSKNSTFLSGRLLFRCASEAAEVEDRGMKM